MLPDGKRSTVLRGQMRWVQCTGLLCVGKVRCFGLRLGVDFPREEDELTATERSLQRSQSAALSRLYQVRPLTRESHCSRSFFSRKERSVSTSGLTYLLTTLLM